MEIRIELRKSFSSASPACKIESNNQSNEKSKFHLSNWMARHFLGDVKQKYKEIYKQKCQDDESKRLNTSPRKNSNRKVNLSVNCESAAIIDKKMLSHSHADKTIKNKKLIDIKKGRLYKGTHRDYN
jgi:hypothetical protein